MSSPNLSPVAAAFALLEGHQEHTVTVKATQARHDFFPLLESVVADPSEVLEVEYKGRQGRALLVNAQFRDYVRLLEQTVRSLPGPAADGPTFRLAGSLSVIGDVQGLLLPFATGSAWPPPTALPTCDAGPAREARRRARRAARRGGHRYAQSPVARERTGPETWPAGARPLRADRPARGGHLRADVRPSRGGGVDPPRPRPAPALVRGVA